MSKNKNEKCIADMYLASAFLAYGAKLLQVDRTDHRRQKFCFENDSINQIYTLEGGSIRTIPKPTLDVVENEFIAKTLLLPPSYPDAIRSIKSAIHASE